MEYIVYKTTNLVNNKYYIGVHYTHKPHGFDGYLGSGTLITRAIEKHGKHNFHRETLVYCLDNEDTAYHIEGLLVKTNKEDKNSYNVKTGGKGRTRTKITTEEEKLNLSKIRSVNNTGSKKYNDGIKEFHFYSTDQTNIELTNKEFKKFLKINQNFKAGRIVVKLTKRTKNFGSRKYNNGNKEFIFHPSIKGNVDEEFDLFLLENNQFFSGTISRKRTKVSPMIGGRKYHNGKEEFLFKSTNLNDEELTNKEFKEFLNENLQFKAGRKHDNTLAKEKLKGIKHYNDGLVNFTFKPENINNRDIEFSEFLQQNSHFKSGQLSKVAKGYKVYSDGITEYKFYDTDNSCKEFILNNPQYKPGRLHQFTQY